MHVVVVVDEPLRRSGRAAQADARADEDLDAAPALHEAVDEVLRERAVDLLGLAVGARSSRSRRG